MKNIILTVFFILINYFCYSQYNKPTEQSNDKLDFAKYLRGVKYAEINTNLEQESYMLSNPGVSGVYLGVSSFLKTMGFEEVGFTSKFSGKNLPSECEKTTVWIKYDVNNNGYITDFSIRFVSCNSDYFLFKSSNNSIKTSSSNFENKIHNACIELYGYKKGSYDPSCRLKLSALYEQHISSMKSTSYNENKLKEYYSTGKIDDFEGIYEGDKYKVGLKKDEDGYILIYISGANNYLDWMQGDVKGILNTPTATPNLFKSYWCMSDKSLNSCLISIEKGLMNVIFDDSKETYIKLYPQASYKSANSFEVSSGTGFAISSDGYIVTNYHVIDGAKSIKIRGINNDFDKTYKAEIAISDKNNDLAIIKISDLNFSNLGSIPFSIPKITVDVGTSIFVLGYPLRATMGDEIKLTNGIVSSKSGFQGDITSYQISAPVQPGNSGGPLFDDSGNIIGIINAKHTGAENAAYAVKCSYLNNLIEQLSVTINLTSTSLKDKSLPEQVKIAKSFVYIIEVE